MPHLTGHFRPARQLTQQKKRTEFCSFLARLPRKHIASLNLDTSIGAEQFFLPFSQNHHTVPGHCSCQYFPIRHLPDFPLEYHKVILIHSIALVSTKHIQLSNSTMMQAPSQPNTSPMKPPAEVPDRSSLMTLLEAASSLDYAQVQGKDADTTGQTQQTQTAGEPTSAYSTSVSYNFLGKKKRPKKASTSPAAKAKVATARPAAKLTLTQLLVASKKGDTTTAAATKKTQKAHNNNKKTTKSPKPTFPQELMRMVTDEANASTIAFLPCGKQFIILDQEAFLNDVLPKSALAMQTPHSNGVKGLVKISSFTRRLNRWGFLQCRVKGLENHLVRYCP